MRVSTYLELLDRYNLFALKHRSIFFLLSFDVRNFFFSSELLVYVGRISKFAHRLFVP